MTDSFPYCQTDYYDETTGTVNTVRCYYCASPFRPCQSFIPTHLTVELARAGTNPVLLENYARLWTANPDGSPNTPLAPPTLIPVTPSLPTDWTAFRIELEPTLLTAHTLYTLTYGSIALYSSPAPRIRWRAGKNLTCPHDIPELNKRWIQNCTNNQLPCDCSAKPWYDFTRLDLYVILEGIPEPEPPPPPARKGQPTLRTLSPVRALSPVRITTAIRNVDP